MHQRNNSFSEGYSHSPVVLLAAYHVTCRAARHESRHDSSSLLGANSSENASVPGLTDELKCPRYCMRRHCTLSMVH